MFAEQRLVMGDVAKADKFSATLLNEAGKPPRSVRERLQQFLFRNGHFDLHQPLLEREEIRSRFKVTVSTPENLYGGKRDGLCRAVLEWVDSGGITLAELIGLKMVLPQAPAGYWADYENARYWTDQMVDEKIARIADGKLGEFDKARKIVLTKRAQDAVEKRLKGEPLSFFENAVYLELKREVACSICEKDFKDCGLSSLLQQKDSKMFEFISWIYPEFKVNIWEIGSKKLAEHFSVVENQDLAVRWLAVQFNKKLRDFTEAEARVYELHETNPGAMSQPDLAKFGKINPQNERDPLTIGEKEFCGHGLKRLIQNLPLPKRAESAIIHAYPERGYALDDFKAPLSEKTSLARQKWLKSENGRKRTRENLDKGFAAVRKIRKELVRTRHRLGKKEGQLDQLLAEQRRKVEIKIRVAEKKKELRNWHDRLKRRQNDLDNLAVEIAIAAWKISSGKQDPMASQAEAVSRGDFFATTGALDIPSVFSALTDKEKEELLSKGREDWHIGELGEKTKGRIRAKMIAMARSGKAELLFKSGAALVRIPLEPKDPLDGMTI